MKEGLVFIWKDLPDTQRHSLDLCVGIANLNREFRPRTRSTMIESLKSPWSGFPGTAAARRAIVLLR